MFHLKFFVFQLNGMSGNTLCLASISTLCCISADRYFAVVRPMRYKHVLTPKRALCMLILVWIGSLSLSCLPLITDYEFHLGMSNCSPAWHHSCGLYAFMTIFAFGAPLVTLLSTYGMIFHSIRRHTKKVSHWRVSSSGPRDLRDSVHGTETTGTARALDSFLSISALEDAKQNCHGIRAKETSPENTPGNSVQDLRHFEGEEESNNTKQSDKKFRSHSAGCNHISPDENFLPFLIQMKSARKSKPLETNIEPSSPSCSVSLRFSISELVAGTVSTMFRPESANIHENELTQSTARSLSLSYANVHSTEPSKLVFPESQGTPGAEEPLQGRRTPNILNFERLRSHSISLTVTTASSPINGPEYNIPAPLSLNGFMSASDEDCTDLTQRMRESKLSSPPLNTQQKTTPQHSNQLQLPPIALPSPARFVKETVLSPSLQRNRRSRSRSLSFETSPEKMKKSANSLHLPPVHKVSSPLLRLRAITQFKRKLRVNSLPREYKIAKIGFILVLVFFLSWGPYVVVHNCQYSSQTPLWVYRIAMWLVYLSCVLNPIVYALSSKHIRLAFSSHMKCCEKYQLGKLQSELLRQGSVPSRRHELKI